MLGSLSACTTDETNRYVTTYQAGLVANTQQVTSKINQEFSALYAANLKAAGVQDTRRLGNIQLVPPIIAMIQGAAAAGNEHNFVLAIDLLVTIMRGNLETEQSRIPQEEIDIYKKTFIQYFWGPRSVWDPLFRQDSEQASSTSAIDTKSASTQPPPETKSQGYVPPV